MSNAEGLELPVLNHPHGAKIGIGPGLDGKYRWAHLKSYTAGVAALVCAITSISILMIHAKLPERISLYCFCVHLHLPTFGFILFSRIQERNHRAHALVASQSTPVEYRQSYMPLGCLLLFLELVANHSSCRQGPALLGFVPFLAFAVMEFSWPAAWLPVPSWQRQRDLRGTRWLGA